MVTYQQRNQMSFWMADNFPNFWIYYPWSKTKNFGSHSIFCGGGGEEGEFGSDGRPTENWRGAPTRGARHPSTLPPSILLPTSHIRVRGVVKCQKNKVKCYTDKKDKKWVIWIMYISVYHIFLKIWINHYTVKNLKCCCCSTYGHNCLSMSSNFLLV